MILTVAIKLLVSVWANVPQPLNGGDLIAISQHYQIVILGAPTKSLDSALESAITLRNGGERIVIRSAPRLAMEVDAVKQLGIARMLKNVQTHLFIMEVAANGRARLHATDQDATNCLAIATLFAWTIQRDMVLPANGTVLSIAIRMDAISKTVSAMINAPTPL